LLLYLLVSNNILWLTPCDETRSNSSLALVQKESFAAVLYVNAMNQFFLSFLVPVVIELGAEGILTRSGFSRCSHCVFHDLLTLISF
jgi:hypothetical protein